MDSPTKMDNSCVYIACVHRATQGYILKVKKLLNENENVKIL